MSPQRRPSARLRFAFREREAAPIVFVEKQQRQRGFVERADDLPDVETPVLGRERAQLVD